MKDLKSEGERSWGLDYRQTWMYPVFTADTERLLTPNRDCFGKNKCLRKQATKHKIVISVTAPQEAICLDSCSPCRRWRCLHKYLHIVLMYPFTSRSINIYSRVKCRLLQFFIASSNGVIPAQIGQLLFFMVLYQASSIQSSSKQQRTEHITAFIIHSCPLSHSLEIQTNHCDIRSQ